MNGSDDEDSSALLILLSTEDKHYEELNELDMGQFDYMAPEAIKKKVLLLFKVRRIMQQNMTTSGEHDNDPYNFVEVAMRKVGRGGLSILGCYYFFKVCDTHPEVDARYSSEMDDALKGNTDCAEIVGTAAGNRAEKTEKKGHTPQLPTCLTCRKPSLTK